MFVPKELRSSPRLTRLLGCKVAESLARLEGAIVLRRAVDM